jgi:DNA-directed RNA polymerase specialized sigma24 family protein
MRQVLVDAARARLAAKRDAGPPPIQLTGIEQLAGGVQSDRTVLAVDAAIDRLTSFSEIKAVLIEMRYFGGMTAEECAEAKSMSVHMVRKELRLAQAWLRGELHGAGDAGR